MNIQTNYDRLETNFIPKENYNMPDKKDLKFTASATEFGFKTHHRDLNDFHSKFEFHKGWEPTPKNLSVRIGMMQEELEEFAEAVKTGDKVDMIDALIDLAYFTIGTADLMGYKWDKHWDAVHSANMEKVRGVKADRPDSGGWDCIKPEGWIAPEARHEEILRGE